MRISVWVYLCQQMLCTICLTAALGASVELQMPCPWRMSLVTVCSGVISLLGAMSSVTAVRVLALAAVPMLPAAAWGRLPRAVWKGMLVPLALLSLLMTGAARLLGSFLPMNLALTAACLLITLTPRMQGRQNPMYCVTLKITCAMGAETMTALIDSGNLLRDHVTGLPVIVLSRSAAQRLTPLPGGGQLFPGMRYLPVKTAAGASMMIIFRPDSVLMIREGSQRVVQAMIGISPDAEAGFTALAPACLLKENPVDLIKHIGG